MRHVPVKVKLVGLLLPLLLVTGLISLRSMSAFKITSVQVVAHGGSMQVPFGIQNELASFVGLSLFQLNIQAVQRKLSAFPTVDKVQLKRKLPSSLLASVFLIDGSALVQAEDESAFYLADGKALVPVDKPDVQGWKKSVVTILVPASYAQMLFTYGLDASFEQVMELAHSLEDKTTLITSIKYDNNSSNSFGKMVLELSSLNAQIWVREPVGAMQVQAAVDLVVQDQKDTLSFLSSDTKRYDLYREGLVRR